MSRPAERIEYQLQGRAPFNRLEDWLPWVLAGVVAFALLYQLGGAALFEPDEGRNAEKAREILVLNDWVTPHENFHPVLDKPIFFYWLIALSYKLFGVSEWAARVPSALAALGCVLLVYYFARSHWGRWEALWSALTLLTSVEFFILARIVIFDMTLTLFETLALWGFYEAAHTESNRRRTRFCMVMYLALGAGTLIKGLVGFVIPGVIFFFYILLRRRWDILRRIHLIPGAVVFLALVLPWYLQAEARNSGYLSYYVWAEHFGRYATVSFDRSEPWYYFILVALIGFFPWTLLLPWMIRHYWKRTWDDKTLFLVLWIVLPFIFFSASKSKLPHYILPIFPAFAIVAGTTLVDLYQQSEGKLRFALSLGWLAQTVNGLYLLVGSFYPAILARQIRGGVDGLTHLVWIYAAFSLLVLGYMVVRMEKHGWVRQSQVYVVQVLGLAFFVGFLAEMMTSISPERSAEPIAKAALAQDITGKQPVFFDTYMAGLSFYLQAQRPVWLITPSKKKRTFLGNYYAIGKRQDPLTPWGKAIFDFDEFREQWKNSKRPLLVILKEKNLKALAEKIAESPKPVATVGDYLLVLKP